MEDHSTLLDEIKAGQGQGIAQIARLVPSFRPGRPTTPQAITRWILAGVVGPEGTRIKLEALRLNRRWITSASALLRFIEAQQPGQQGATSNTAAARPARQQQKKLDVQRQLTEMGF